MQPDTFCQKWFCGLTVHVCPFEVVYTILDRFFAQGVTYLFQFGIALMQHFKEVRGLLTRRTCLRAKPRTKCTKSSASTNVKTMLWQLLTRYVAVSARRTRCIYPLLGWDMNLRSLLFLEVEWLLLLSNSCEGVVWNSYEGVV